MKKQIFILLTAISLQIQAQKNANDSLEQSKVYYKLAIQYKDGSGVPMNYKTAFEYFSQAAKLGDVQSVYATAYMQYKGLGCVQDYKSAATLFAQGASLGKDNSMYFYGLCWRNGYGVNKSEDSAKYWLQKSADLGYAQAFKELNMAVGENGNDSAKKLLQQISNAAIPQTLVLNQYQSIENHLPSMDIIAGFYRGYIIQYDWSGKNAISTKRLALDLSGHSKSLEGFWIEENTDSFKLKASLYRDSLSFSDTKYWRTDHYSPTNSVKYDIQNAKLNLVQKKDTVFLAGNIIMFSPERKEPSKPVFVALFRLVNLDKTAFSTLKVSPNPFISKIDVAFTLTQPSKVEVQLLTIDGTIIYRNPGGILNVGHYLLPLNPGNISSGTYLLKVITGAEIKTFKVIKM